MPPWVAPVARSLIFVRMSFAEIPHQRVDPAELEVSPVDQPDPFGFVFDHSNLAVLHLIAEGQGTADPETLSL